MKPVIHLIDVTDFTLPDGTVSADWYRDAFDTLGVSGEIECLVHDGVAGDLPGPGTVAQKGSGVIISGSAGPVYEDKPWIPPLLEFLSRAHEAGAWILGVCFGHHALAAALGGEVTENPRGREMGTVCIYLTPEGEGSPLFDGFSSGDSVNLVHRTHVSRMPQGAVRLAFNQMTHTQAFQVGRSFGLQFHPELIPLQLEQLAGMYGNVLIRKEKFLDGREHLGDYVSTFRETPSSRAILLNFIRMISQ